jgi:hypothetical protein
MGDVRRALADPHPLDFLLLASSLFAALDRRGHDPFDRAADEQRLSREEVLRTFIEADRPETAALLTAFAAMSADEVERRRFQSAVAIGGHRLRAWLEQLGAAHAYAAAEMTHILGDGDTVFVGVRLSTGQDLTAFVYIDHNLGTVVKDAFVVADPIATILRLVTDRNEDPHVTVADLPLAEAKARIADAVRRAAMTYPPFETDTWPACRPLVEWMVGLLPDGGRGYERPDWSEADRQQLAERFFDSPFGAPIDDEDHRSLLESILWFGCDYGPGDPLRWSPVAVEILLDDWIPRKIVADTEYLAKAPAVLRAFIRYCDAARGISARLTEETLGAVDEWEPDYQEAIRTKRPQGPVALLAAMGVLDDDEWGMPLDETEAQREYAAIMRPYLERAVGGPEALDELDDAPVPDEPFEWTGIADDLRDRVGEVLELLDRCCDELLDIEHRTACRRVLARIAREGPQAFRRRGRSDTAAAAICWAVCRANETFEPWLGGFTQKALAGWFGLGGSSGLRSRAATLLDAGGFSRYPADFVLGSPDYLVSARRRQILERRAELDSWP